MREISAGLERALEELYGTPPSEFTKKRDMLAKDLSREDAAAATALRARRKPTQIAWVLNQLARRHAAEVAELADVGRELARAQRQALRGEPTSFRESIARQRQVVRDVTQTASTVMKDLGLDPRGHLDEVAAALRAALVDPAFAIQLEEGRLEKAPEAAVSFAGPIGLEAKEPPAEGRKRARPERAPARAKGAEARADRKTVALAKKRASEAAQAERQAAALARKRTIAEERAERKATAQAQRAEREAAARAQRQALAAERKARAQLDKAITKARAALREAEADARRRLTEATRADREAQRLRLSADALLADAEERGRQVTQAREDLAHLEAQRAGAK